ncbi:MAG TPA: hypothetical protein PKY88_08930 [Anaerohalosphaeraceae bacterium]|nr:hypothetical protein [Anaerohalosphaeraceae bacterium]
MNRTPMSSGEPESTEQKNETKTSRNEQSIFFWVCHILPALLILLGLYVRLPWKVLGLLCLLLLPALLLKSYSKKVRYGLLGGVLLVLVWVFLPAKPDLQWKPYALEDQIRIWRQAQEIPDGENAAVLYKELFARKDWEGLQCRLSELDPQSAAVRHPWQRGGFPRVGRLAEGE